MAQPIGDEAFKRKIEEFKEAGQEYRYRDQLMVQEFSLSMVATGIVFNTFRWVSGWERIAVQFFGFLFLCLLTLHLRNINQDRIAASHRKDVLRNELGFESTHQNVIGKRRIRVPRLMIQFCGAVTLIWFFWTAFSAWQFISSNSLSDIIFAMLKCIQL